MIARYASARSAALVVVVVAKAPLAECGEEAERARALTKSSFTAIVVIVVVVEWPSAISNAARRLLLESRARSLARVDAVDDEYEGL